MEEWKECKLGDIVEIHRGASPRPIQKFIATSGMPWVKISDATASNSRFINSTKEFIIEDGISKSVIVNPEDLIVSNSATPGLPKIMKIKACIHDGWLYFSNYKNISRDFLYYKFFDIQKHLTNLANGSVFQNLKTDIVKDFTIKLPPLPIQQKIARILSSLDDKIELNNKINTNLEQQAQALFKNWFVDFEPFGGKMPEGWKEADIYSIANIIYGSPFASKLFNTEKNGKPIIRIRDLKDQHSDVYTPEKRDDAYLIQPKDIVVGMDGEFRPYIWGSEPGWLNQRVCVFENKRPKGKAFLYFSIKPLLDVVEKTQVATTVIHIGKKDFDKFQIILPTEDILDRFDELTDPILDQIVANRLENRRLAELRDTLLPRLMNGELKI